MGESHADRQGRRDRHGNRLNQAQQGFAADQHGKPARQARASLTAGMQSEAALRLSEANGPPGPRQGHLR
jgi:hypothetical protein